jgi:tetratricopeptide (TPR) repeat protein
MDTEIADLEHAGRLNELGSSLVGQGRFDDAIEQFSKATALYETAGSSDRKLALRNWADALRSKKLYEEAARKYDEAIAADPDFAAAYNGLGLALAEQERFDDAIEQHRRAATLFETAGSPDRKHALHNWADALRAKKLYGESEEKYREAIAADPDFAAAYNKLGLALADQGRFDDAIEQYGKAAELWEIAKSPDRKLALHNWADALRSKKLYEEAAKKYDEVIAADPDFAPAYNGLGIALADQQRFDDAIVQYSKAATLYETAGSPARKLALRNWADALRAKKLYEESVKKYDEAIAADPDFALAYNGLGIVLADQQRFDDAIVQYCKAAELWEIAKSPDRKLALCNWADALRAKKLYEEAARKYGEAIAADPDFAAAYNELGFTLAEQERFDDAIVQYRKAAELLENAKSPDRKLALYNWAEALRAKKLYEEAATKYGGLIAADPDFAPAYYGLGLALADQERFDDAIVQYRKADALLENAKSPDRKLALHNWADALRGKKLHEEAAKKYGEAIAADPDFAPAYNDLGVTLAEQERFDDAIEQFSKAAALFETSGSPARKHALSNWANALRSKKLYEEAAKKYGEIIAADPDFALAYNGLGIVLAGQRRFDEAIEQYSKADALWEKAKSDDRKFGLLNWGTALSEQERFDDAIEKFAQATAVARNDAVALFYYGISFAACWRYREAIAQFDRAALLDRKSPHHHHNKAHALFQLGRYEDGWKEWLIARDHYEDVIPDELRNKDDSENALYFADLLREIFSDYAKSEEYYQRAIRRRGDDAGAWTGLAILYQQWADSEDAPSEIRARLSYVIHRAVELLRGQLDQGEQLKTLLSLADLQIEIRDWPEARESLALAASFCDGSRLKRAEIVNRLGLVCYLAEEHSEAVKHFRQALMVRPGDLTLRRSFGMALQRSKQFEAAQDEFARVLKSAPAHVDALLGAAEVCIELADDGDPDQYRAAERHLTLALQHGRNRQSGSKRLRPADVGNIYYLRGYVRTKRYESDGPGMLSTPLLGALSDFQQCRRVNPKHPKAPEAIAKITQRFRQRASGAFVDVFGPLVIFGAGAVVFLLAQLDFFFRDTAIRAMFSLPPKSAVVDATVYAALTFGALVFMVAGLYLPKVLKLKVPGIELEKSSVDRVSAPSTLDISRFGSLTK